MMNKEEFNQGYVNESHCAEIINYEFKLVISISLFHSLTSSKF